MFRLPAILILWMLPFVALSQPHPVCFITKAEGELVKKKIPQLPLLRQSFTEIKLQVDALIGKEVEVPLPKDAAGGYTHDRHKANYTLMFHSGLLYNLTGEKKYADFVKGLLMKYAAMNPLLKNHPQSTGSSPGRIFWQALNDANWMVYSGMAYDLIYNSLTGKERKQIEEGAFKPEVEYFTQELQVWFDRMHNHSVWACAGVGIIGIATNNTDYVEMALNGSNKNGKSGFLAQMDNLFSPDGYYTEGPYYMRYAILPFMLFANALNNQESALKIFEHRDRVLQKALNTCLQLTNTDGTFFPLNDAIKEKDFTSNELVTSLGISWKVYGTNVAYLPVAKKQGRVLLNQGGVGIAQAMQDNKNIPAYYPYTTLEITDGVKGDEGGLTVIRTGKGKEMSSLLFKYSAHGFGHGHFDKLGINFFDKGNEILSDYGSARFIGVEQKFGGRYLKENASYASQTVAHNTLVVDGRSQFNGDEDLGQKFHADKLYADYSNSTMQVVLAEERNAYEGVGLRRGIYSLVLPGGKKMIVDIFAATSSLVHQYDLPFHYSGQVIQASFKYVPHVTELQPLGVGHGYQHLWKEAEATIAKTTSQFTFLNAKTFYTLSSWVQDSTKLFFVRTGANDPDYNLRREPAYIIRKRGDNQLFVNVLEIHGEHDPVHEFSIDAYPVVKEIRVLRNDSEYIIAEIIMKGHQLLVTQSNNQLNKDKSHTAKLDGMQLSWSGPCAVFYDGKKL